VTRLPYLDAKLASAPVQEALAILPDLHLFRVLAHAEGALVPWLALGGALLSSLSLDPRLRELAILQVARSAGSDYERLQHEAIAAGVGVPPEQIRAVVGGHLEDPVLGDSAPVLRFVDELVRTHATSDAGFAVLREHLSDRECVELLLVVGHYLGLALLVGAVDLDPDAPAQMAVVDLANARRGELT
jgi:alkylhydroperoxidase family enzyme